MAGSVNKVIIIGNIGNDPEIKSMQSGDRVANLTVATSESWKDKSTGEKKERTEWHRVVIFNQPLVNVCENYLAKGSKVYIEGQLETRSWEQNGEKKYTTEIVLRPFRGEITMLDSKGGQSGGFSEPKPSGRPVKTPPLDEMEDEIPFAAVKYIASY